MLGVCHYAKGEDQIAKGILQETVARQPGSAWARLWLISVLVDVGSWEEASTVARTVMSIEHNFSVSKWYGARFKDEQFRQRVMTNLTKAGLPE